MQNILALTRRQVGRRIKSKKDENQNCKNKFNDSEDKTFYQWN